MKRVLFLCTGNYYRSRFAEHLFNHHAKRLDLDWIAESRALALEKGSCNVGPMSPYTVAALHERNVPIPEPLRFPRRCETCDFESADLVVALKELEHRQYMQRKFPGWEDRITYWHVHDVDQATPNEAMGMIDCLVTELVRKCQGELTAGGRGSS